jgi:cellulose synthase/poly-beta-1,6-N-acetylglucosamine synthase-like glycosyltransferase
MPHKIDITVIIPTYNSEKYISRALHALYERNTCIPSQVIIVDGESKDSTVKKAREYPVEIFSNPKISAADARNIGIKFSKGDIIAFTDSDCVPDKNWLENIFKRFKNNPELIGTGGKMLPLKPKNNIETFSANVFLNEIMKFPKQIFKPLEKFLPGSFITANCAYRKEALIKVGGFNEFFKNNGEDIDLFWRMIDKFPGNLLYDPSIIVYHSFPDSYIKLAKKYFQYGIASSKLAKFHLKTPSIDLFVYKKLLKHFIKLMNPLNSHGKVDLLYLIQLTSHILGKVYGSIIVKRINL